jgi:hypothetical protein
MTDETPWCSAGVADNQSDMVRSDRAKVRKKPGPAPTGKKPHVKSRRCGLANGPSVHALSRQLEPLRKKDERVRVWLSSRIELVTKRPQKTSEWATAVIEGPDPDYTGLALNLLTQLEVLAIETSVPPTVPEAKSYEEQQRREEAKKQREQDSTVPIPRSIARGERGLQAYRLQRLENSRGRVAQVKGGADPGATENQRDRCKHCGRSG